MLLGVLHCVPDWGDPASIVAKLVDAAPPGSYLTIAHPASDVATDQMAASMWNYNEHVAVPLTVRSHDEVSAFRRPGPGGARRGSAAPVPAGAGDPGTGRELANCGGLAVKR